ncbi:MAG: hypothetical protein A3F92_02090 [Candidatus Rokubacteria bacterium RIFCSPLOWO2_12_FULL_71_22]|nr:MAG: hypothetical protein A3F92_02090 [Candidatus Rokubacteria bacterium RIFCSPLOWO2_12_FULL_71_22]
MAGSERNRKAVVHPDNACLAERLRAGEQPSPPAAEPSVSVQWNGEVPPEVASFLTSGDHEALARLLEARPQALLHPVVQRQISHLRWLRRQQEEGDLDDGGVLFADLPIVPTGTREAARDALIALVSAWCRGQLGAGWRLEPPKGRPGRRRSRDDEQRYADLLVEYEDVLTELRKHPVKGRKRASGQNWHSRLCDVIRQVWADSGLGAGFESHLPPGETDLWQAVTMLKPEPLPEQRVKKWAQEALDHAAEGPLRDRLAYTMVAYSWDLKPDQVRSAVQTARKWYEGASRGK